MNFENVDDIKIGKRQVHRIYQGSTIVWEKKKDVLPSGYSACEYIESVSNAYINTDIKVSSITKTTMIFSLAQVQEQYASLFGVRNGSGSVGRYSVRFESGATGITNFFQKSPSPTSDYVFNSSGVSQSSSVGKIRTVILGNEAIVDDQIYKIYNHTDTTRWTYPVFIFGINSRGSLIDNFPYIRCYEFYMEENGEELIHLYPCLDENGVPCMYDSVTKNTFYNAGKGTFLYKLK